MAYVQLPDPLCIRNAPASAWMVQCIRSSGRQDTVANSGPSLRDRLSQPSKNYLTNVAVNEKSTRIVWRPHVVTPENALLYPHARSLSNTARPGTEQ